MALSVTLTKRLAQTVTLSTMSGMTAYGTATYGTAKTYRARVQQMHKYLKGPEGREVLATTQVYLGMTSSNGFPPRYLAPTTKIVLPDGTSPSVLAVEENPAADGSRHHMVLYCG